ncbi:MAG TPA: GNAT family N-acetyltransferase [Herpetosiphonaceae bacterium]
MSVRPARASEYDQIIELIKQTFDPGDEAWVIAAATMREDPRFRPEHLRVFERQGQIVGVVNVIDRFVHIGTAQVRCAIVAPLATAKEHQNTGVGSALMRDTLDWARAGGFQLSMLWGHTWLYPRYGYAPGIKSYSVRLPIDLQPLGDKAYTLRAYKPSDVPALLQVYQAETASMTLAEVRSDQPWEWRPFQPNTTIEVAIDPAGAIRGYARISIPDERMLVGEIAAMDHGAAQALYDRLLYLARERQIQAINVIATPDNRWTRLAFRQGAQICVASGGGAGMVRVLDLPGLLQTIQPELQRRAARSELVTRKIEVRIESPVGRATVRVDHGRVDLVDGGLTNAVTLPFHALGPLVTGYQPIGELLGLSGVFLYGSETQRLLDVLFPEGYPHWSFAAYFT